MIDGQQRLQSFYIGLNGSLNGKILYFDLFSDYNSEYEFKFENDENKLPKQSKDNLERPIKKHFWYPAKSLLTKLKEIGRYKQVVREIIETANINDDKKKEYIEDNRNLLNDYGFATNLGGFINPEGYFQNIGIGYWWVYGNTCKH